MSKPMTEFKSTWQVNLASAVVNTDGRTGRTHEEPRCVTALLLSATRAGGAKANDDEGLRSPVIRRGERGEIPLDVRRGVYRRDAYRCHYCAATPGERRLDLDHMIPWSAGGSDASHNLRALCQPCNERRSNYDDRERHKRVLPVTWWCIDCHSIDDERPWWELQRPEWVRPAPPRIDGRERLTFAYCARCDINSYAEVVL